MVRSSAVDNCDPVWDSACSSRSSKSLQVGWAISKRKKRPQSQTTQVVQLLVESARRQIT